MVMKRNNTLRGIALTLAASALAMPFSASALDAHGEAAVSTTLTELTAGGVTASVAMPCAEPDAGPAGPEGMESLVCVGEGGVLFIFVTVENIEAGSDGPFSSNFDAAREEIANSPDTVSADVSETDGRRTIFATRGPEPKVAFAHVIELADDTLAYAISMSIVDTAQPEEMKADMRKFAESLEVAE